MNDLSHLDPEGRVRMVDVSAKGATARVAVAEGFLVAAPDTIRRIETGGLPKGDFRPTVQLAGIQAAKRTADLIPLCHPLPLDHVAIEVETDSAAGRVRVVATTTVTARTGVEMEALTAVSVALLTAWDLLKAVDRGLRIEGVRLLEKRGGRTGDWRAENP
ncbi:MAG: cyclic pyranopterin monophosphate synthase MoaC [Gemmatimonadetes bacterium]|nr:cyclic pyranopterin monophosphate synthase MoaC [Gemmatimonadota bacterium]